MGSMVVSLNCTLYHWESLIVFLINGSLLRNNLIAATLTVYICCHQNIFRQTLPHFPLPGFSFPFFKEINVENTQK